MVLSTPKFRIIGFKALLNASDDCVVLDVFIILGFIVYISFNFYSSVFVLIYIAAFTVYTISCPNFYEPLPFYTFLGIWLTLLKKKKEVTLRERIKILLVSAD
jgi:hypothetical protein